MLRSGNENVFGFDVTMEKVPMVDVLETGHDLEEDALDAVGIHGFVVAGLHELVEISVSPKICALKTGAARRRHADGGYEFPKVLNGDASDHRRALHSHGHAGVWKVGC